MPKKQPVQKNVTNKPEPSFAELFEQIDLSREQVKALVAPDFADLTQEEQQVLSKRFGIGTSVRTFPVETLPRISKAKIQALHEQGITDIRDIPDSMPLSEAQSQVRETVKTGRLFLSDEAAALVDALPYPRFYLDFETVQFAEPRWPDSRSYEQIPFQWSCHIEDGFGRLPRHYEYLAKNDEYPRREFAEMLIACFTGEEPGPVIVYNAAFEKRILEETAKALPDLAEALNAIRDRVFDLLPVARQHYYHPEMHGSWSIKRVLPTIAPELDYSNLDVQHGGMAQASFLHMLNAAPGSPRQEALYKELLCYCERDTLAMLRIARFFAGNRAELGRLYLYGGNEKFPQNEALGFELLQAAYERGYGDDALYVDLVQCYLYGRGIEQNFLKASQMVDALHDEINEGNPQAMYLRGLVSHEISADPEVGLAWIRKAAEKGHAVATMFLNGLKQNEIYNGEATQMDLMTGFSQTTKEDLGYYVYALIDPRDSKIFYIGKGEGDRVFQHELEENDKAKNVLIREIQNAGLEVKKLIIRHGMKEDEAFNVEAALIDLLNSGLWKDCQITNLQSGHNTIDRGMKTILEIEAFYTVDEIQKEDFAHNAMVININKSYKKVGDIYEATRGKWVVSEKRLPNMEIVISEYKGVFRAIFKPSRWYPSDETSKSGTVRMCFEGEDVSGHREYQRYLNKRNGFKRQGQANPVQYVIIS
jgi:hypothetical protein